MQIEIAVEKTSSPQPLPPFSELGFGRYFSDHMFMVDYSGSRGWHAPRVSPRQPLKLDPGAAALHYGQAMFEGMKAFAGVDQVVRLFRPEMNWQRMQEGAARLCMPCPAYDVFLAGLIHLIRTDFNWIPTLPGTALYIRPTLIGTEAFLGVRPSDRYLFFVLASPVGSYYGDKAEAVKIWVESQFARAAAGGVGSVKAAGNYAASLLAATRAKERGYAQVLWLDAAQKRFVEEVGTMNVFFKFRDRVVTPPLNGTILPGVMRDSALRVLRDWGLTVEERSLEWREVESGIMSGDLEEVFGTGTAAVISPVGVLGTEQGTLLVGDGLPGVLSKELFSYITGIQTGRISDTRGWTHLIPAN